MGCEAGRPAPRLGRGKSPGGPGQPKALEVTGLERGSSLHFTGEQTEARRGEGTLAPDPADRSLRALGSLCCGHLAGSHITVAVHLLKLCDLDLAWGWRGGNRPPLHPVRLGPRVSACMPVTGATFRYVGGLTPDWRGGSGAPAAFTRPVPTQGHRQSLQRPPSPQPPDAGQQQPELPGRHLPASPSPVRLHCRHLVLEAGGQC